MGTQTFRARVFVTLKAGINDPQGLTIRGGLHSLGFAEVESVRAGKYMEIAVSADTAEAAGQRIDEMCRKLLANPVIEEYRFEVDRATGL